MFIPKIGTRKSKLAHAYTLMAKEAVGLQMETVLIDSKADLNPSTSIEEMGGKGVFCKEIEQSLMDGDIDIACHAFKDLTRDNDKYLEVPCVVTRNDHHDCLVGNNINPRTIGTSSPRRIQQIRDLYPNAEIIPIRGNIDTRIQKQENGEYDAIVLAKAGLDALGISDKISRVFGTADMLPAPGQGVIALQCRKNDKDYMFSVSKVLSDKNCLDTWYTCMAEKQALIEIDGDCHTAVGMLSVIDGGIIKIIGKNFETDKLGIVSGPKHEYEQLGSDLGRSLI